MGRSGCECCVLHGCAVVVESARRGEPGWGVWVIVDARGSVGELG